MQWSFESNFLGHFTNAYATVSPLNSQGAQVARRATKLIPSGLGGNIGGIVLFGDPNYLHPFPEGLKSYVNSICNDGDLICQGLPFPFGPHLEYEKTTPKAAQWIYSRSL